LISGSPGIDFLYRYQVDEHIFEFSTADVKQELEDIPISDMSVIHFLAEYLKSNIEQLYKEGHL
jgi:hypothetical protein